MTDELSRPIVPWSRSATGVALVTLVVLGLGFAATLTGMPDLRMATATSLAIGIAATCAANLASPRSARLAAWLGVWVAAAFLVAGLCQAASGDVPLLVASADAGLAAIVLLVGLALTRSIPVRSEVNSS